MISRFLVEMFSCISQVCSRHPARMRVEKRQQSLPIALSRFAQPATGCFVNQVMIIIQQQFGELERVIDIAFSDEVPGADDRGPPLPNIFRACESV